MVSPVNVGLLRIRLLPDDFRRRPIRRSAERHGLVGFYVPAEPEIADLGIEVVVDHNVPGFEVPLDDLSSSMKVLHPSRDIAPEPVQYKEVNLRLSLCVEQVIKICNEVLRAREGGMEGGEQKIISKCGYRGYVAFAVASLQDPNSPPLPDRHWEPRRKPRRKEQCWDGGGSR